MPSTRDGDYPLMENMPRTNRFRNVTLGHLKNFIGGDYGSQNLSSVLYEARDGSESAVKLEVWSAPDLSKPSFAEAVRQKYKKISKGFKFGPSWSNHWVKATLTVPKQYQDRERVLFEFDPGCEALIFTSEGLPLQGITGGTDSAKRIDFIIPKQNRAFPLQIYIEVSANALFGVPDEGQLEVHDDVFFELAMADIAIPRMDAWHLMWDFQVISDLTKSVPVTSPICLKAQTVAMDIMNTFKPDNLETIPACRKIAEKILGAEWTQKPIYDPKSDWDLEGDSEGVPVFAIGHCHIDTAWEWPFSVTQQKVARSWATQVDLIQRYPEYRFVASTAQQYKWLEELYPQLFSKVRREVENGKFFVTGGSWVENDTNMPSGEALCRQFLYGQRYFKSRFGKYTDIFWLPDSFGYASQIPQICRQSGIPYFFTQKMSWSEFNKFPHSTFNWIGIDGTQVLVHMTPVDTYNAQANVDEVLKAITNHKDLEWSDKTLLVYGNGDGGGGPLAPMIEKLRRIRSASNNSSNSGVPKVTTGPSVSDFYKMLLNKTRNGKDLPTWRGELYLEYHRGTYTSHGSIKRHNRKSEILMREIEYFATLASLFREDTGYEYPKDELDHLWEIVLLCQFHDVLPGSAIAKVYEDAEKLYAEVAQKGAALLEAARQSALYGSQAVDVVTASSNRGGNVVGLNTLSFPRQEILRVPLEIYDGRSAFSASKTDEDSVFVIAKDATGNGLIELESLSHLQEHIQLATASVGRDVKTGEVCYFLANKALTVQISSQGRIVSIVDIELGRELILSGQSSGFVIYQDQPLTFDAWNADIFHLDTKEIIDAINVKVVEPKGLRASIVVECVYKQSKISATISLDAVPGSLKKDALSLVRFETTIDWHEQHKFLKFEVPLDISSDQATYEIQYGVLQRPTHKNTTWDAAKFEVCGHRFADLSEFGYGVALLNDCKYGYACEGSYLRLSLLRASTSPDPRQDQGMHKMRFGILPHRGHFLESDVPQVAMAFNNPIHLRYAPRNISSKNLLAPVTEIFKLEGLGARNVILDTVKRGEDDTFGFHSRKPVRTVVVRLYEAFGGRANVHLVTLVKAQEVFIVDVLERELEKVELKNHQQSITDDQEPYKQVVELNFKPFQFISLKFILS
ncbi:Glycoside hydrolase, 38 vacuolar alpha mannosidase [Puccinia graminis f. sp. tritici]|uniref:Alpha-mannosidase n=1 Tax=Puccinia graminis f. sp. tritici TaxID=56615 RepID=A0A5B0QNN0_PUCGR|nr:Glycoside hydrolase, 38 vacuolar alpha mannosidase [Puccinia graminis f. sp. tritici]